MYVEENFRTPSLNKKVLVYLRRKREKILKILRITTKITMKL
ncbi:hypothetical protein CpecS_0650 [Chlamydia pecorum VR629]|nr:hypothetical protein CpecS_0650 [Chlamydia pecorum VR629]